MSDVEMIETPTAPATPREVLSEHNSNVAVGNLVDLDTELPDERLSTSDEKLVADLETQWKYPDRDPLATLVAAADFAARQHKYQRRKDTEQTPYVNHPLGVARILTEEGKVSDMELIQVAMLHDTMEDADVSLTELVENFGIRVAAFVAELTDNKSYKKYVRKRLQVENAPTKSSGAKIVAMCDKIYNLRDLMRQTPVDWTQERVNEYFSWAEEVVQHYYSENKLLAKILKDIFKTHKKALKDAKAKAKSPTVAAKNPTVAKKVKKVKKAKVEAPQ